MTQDKGWISGRILSTRDLTKTVREILIRPERCPSTIPTGAHLAVRVQINGRLDERHYSLIGTQVVGGCLRIAVKLEQQGSGGSQFMWRLEPDDEVEILSPVSHFELSWGAPEYLLFAGGIGITPLVGMAHALKKRGDPFRLVYVGRSRMEMAYVEDLAADLDSSLLVIADDEIGSLDLAAIFAPLAAGAEIYVCGPPGMISAARKIWLASGRSSTDFISERFGGGTVIPSQPFTVKIPSLGKQIDVPAGVTMLAALEDAGIEMLSNCRRGECGLCTVDILDLQGVINHQDVFLSQHQQAEGRTICTCVSRMAGGTITISPAYIPDDPV